MSQKTIGMHVGILAFLLATICLSGCDQFQSMFQANLPSSSKAGSKTVSKSDATEIPQGTVLAKVNNDVITLESFDEKIKAIETFAPDAKLKTADDRKAFLNDLISQELMVQEAKSRGIDKRKDIRDAIDDFRKTAYVRQLLIDETKGITVEASEIESFYNQYKKEFATPQELKVREIVVSSEATAREILISLLQGADFATTAKERSISASASKGGDLGIVKPGEKFESFDKAIAALDEGQVSPIFKGPDGYYIVKIEQKKGGTVPALAEVFDQIKAGLLQQKQSERVQNLADKLKRDAKIEIKEELLR